MTLTATEVKNAKPRDSIYSLYDVDGLSLEVPKDGKSRWRFKYQRPATGKPNRISLGTYPEISLKAARARRDEVRTDVANGIDPSEKRKATRAAGEERAKNSFEAIALEWFRVKCGELSPEYTGRLLARLQRDVFPWLGKRPIAEITPGEMLTTMRRIEERGAIETAHRVLNTCGQIFKYAMGSDRAERNFCADLQGQLMTVKGDHFAAETDPIRLGEILRILDGYTGSPIVQAALKLAPLLFVRPGELRQAKWADINLDTAEWRFTVSKTKTEHIVPLASQAVEIFRELHPITQDSEYVFPGARSPKRPLSDAALAAAMRRMDISKEQQSIHGFRATARTLLDEVLGFRPDFIEHQLAHSVRDPLGRAYNRTKHLDQRKEMMQHWADYLDGLKVGSKVIPIERASRS